MAPRLRPPRHRLRPPRHPLRPPAAPPRRPRPLRCSSPVRWPTAAAPPSPAAGSAAAARARGVVVALRAADRRRSLPFGGWFGPRPRCLLAVGRPCGLRVVTMVVGLRDRDGGPRRRDRRSRRRPEFELLRAEPIPGRSGTPQTHSTGSTPPGGRWRAAPDEPRRSSGDGGPVGRSARPGRLRRRRRGRPALRPHGPCRVRSSRG